MGHIDSEAIVLEKADQDPILEVLIRGAHCAEWRSEAE